MWTLAWCCGADGRDTVELTEYLTDRVASLAAQNIRRVCALAYRRDRRNSIAPRHLSGEAD